MKSRNFEDVPLIRSMKCRGEFDIPVFMDYRLPALFKALKPEIRDQIVMAGLGDEDARVQLARDYEIHVTRVDDRPELADQSLILLAVDGHVWAVEVGAEVLALVDPRNY